MAITGIVVFTSCNKNSPTSVTLKLHATYGNSTFSLNQANIDPAGRYIEMNTAMFYLSHINLIKKDGSTVPLKQVALFDLNDPTLMSASGDNIQGDFTGISFVCGLDSMQNDTTNPLNYSIPNPLSGDYNMYWGMMKYRFEVFEGKWDTAVMPIMRNGLLYHVGTNTAYRETTLTKNFTVNKDPYTLDLYLDVEKIFYNTATGETLDIVTQPTTSSQSNEDPAILKTFTDNFSKAFSL